MHLGITNAFRYIIHFLNSIQVHLLRTVVKLRFQLQKRKGHEKRERMLAFRSPAE